MQTLDCRCQCRSPVTPPIVPRVCSSFNWQAVARDSISLSACDLRAGSLPDLIDHGLDGGLLGLGEISEMFSRVRAHQSVHPCFSGGLTTTRQGPDQKVEMVADLM